MLAPRDVAIFTCGRKTQPYRPDNEFTSHNAARRMLLFMTLTSATDTCNYINEYLELIEDVRLVLENPN